MEIHYFQLTETEAIPVRTMDGANISRVHGYRRKYCQNNKKLYRKIELKRLKFLPFITKNNNLFIFYNFKLIFRDIPLKVNCLWGSC